MRNGVRVVCLLGWHGPSGAVSWIPGDDSRLGDVGTLFSYCDSCAPDFDDGPADGPARLVVEHNGVSGADIQVTVALVSVGVAGRRVVLALMLGQSLLVAEGSSYRSAVTVHVGLLLGAAVGGLYHEHTAGQAFDGGASALKCGVVAVGFSDTELVSCPRH